MTFRRRHRIPDLGVGVGFRIPHYAAILDAPPPTGEPANAAPTVDWFEVISENFMVPGGRPIANLDRLRAKYPVVNHGVSLSIGGTAPLDDAYLARLKALVKRIDPPWCSDHLCWGGTSRVSVHDLLPLPMTKGVAAHVVERIKRVQGFLEKPFAIENVSSYLAFRESAMKEWDFVAEIAEKADCGILFDVNNVYVSARNHGFDANEYVDAIPEGRVVQMHLAGHTDHGTHVLDTHSDHVRDEVWTLYERAVAKCGAVSTLVEWDEDIPEWSVLAAEAHKARDVRKRVLDAREKRATRAARGEASAE